MNAADTIADHLERFGDYERVKDGDVWWTSGEIDRRARSVASGLRELGVERNDRVAVMMPNSVELLAVYAAIWHAGATIMPLLPAVSDADLAGLVASGSPRAVVGSGASAERLAGAAPAGVAVVGDTGTGLASVDELALAAPADSSEKPAELAALLFTGGTTGRAKGVCLTHAQLLWNARTAAGVTDVDDDDVILITLPLSHSFGLSTFLGSFFHGGRLIVEPRFSPSALRAVLAAGATVTDVVPAMLGLMLEDPQLDADVLGRLRAIKVGGAPCPPELIDSFAGLGVPVYEGYGLTEAGPVLSAQRPGLPIKPGSVGPPLPGVEIRIEAAAGERDGEVLARSPSLMSGYWNDLEATAAALRDGWLRTGDLGRIDDDGYLWITGRAKDLVIRNGFNIHPLDVEAALRECAGVDDALVVGVPDRRLGKRLVAVVTGSVAPEALERFCRERIAATKRPDAVRVVDDLPRTGVGKPDRVEMVRRLGSDG